MKDELLELATRVEALTGPDREVDATIAAHVRYGLPPGAEWALKFPKWEVEPGWRICTLQTRAGAAGKIQLDAGIEG